MRLNIRGRDGRLLSTEWADGPKSYLGVSVAGFPNMFVVTGPGGPAALSNVVVSIEQNVEWIAQLLDYAKRCGFDYIDVDRGVQERWSTMVADLAADTLYAKAKSWYWGSNVAGKPRTFLAYLGGVGKYREICEAHAQSCYPGFIFARNRKT
jgi:cyclohexanone monooxygenase